MLLNASGSGVAALRLMWVRVTSSPLHRTALVENPRRQLLLNHDGISVVVLHGAPPCWHTNVDKHGKCGRMSQSRAVRGEDSAAAFAHMTAVGDFGAGSTSFWARFGLSAENKCEGGKGASECKNGCDAWR